MKLCAWIVILLHMVPLALNCGGGGGGGGCFVGKSKCPNTASPYCMPNSEKWRCCKAGKHCKLVPCPWVCRDYQRRCVCCDEPFDCKFGNCKCPAKGWRFYSIVHTHAIVLVIRQNEELYKLCEQMDPAEFGKLANATDGNFAQGVEK